MYIVEKIKNNLVKRYKMQQLEKNLDFYSQNYPFRNFLVFLIGRRWYVDAFKEFVLDFRSDFRRKEF